MVPVAAIKDEQGRSDQPGYFLCALQEAVVNAIVHSDYSIQGAQMKIFLLQARPLITLLRRRKSFSVIIL